MKTLAACVPKLGSHLPLQSEDSSSIAQSGEDDSTFL